MGKSKPVPAITPGLTLPSTTWPCKFTPRLLSSLGPLLWQPRMFNEPGEVINYVCAHTSDSSPSLACWYFRHPFDPLQVPNKNHLNKIEVYVSVTFSLKVGGLNLVCFLYLIKYPVTQIPSILPLYQVWASIPKLLHGLMWLLEVQPSHHKFTSDSGSIRACLCILRTLSRSFSWPEFSHIATMGSKGPWRM